MFSGLSTVEAKCLLTAVRTQATVMRCMGVPVAAPATPALSMSRMLAAQVALGFAR